MTKVRDELKTTQLKMLGVLNGVLDSLTPRPARPAAPADVARRQMANILRLSHVCARNTCRRAGSCRGEPSECLRYGLHLASARSACRLVQAAWASKPSPPPPRRVRLVQYVACAVWRLCNNRSSRRHN